MEKKLKYFGQILLFIILTELVLGGGGRFTALGPVSLRMILYGFALLYTIILAMKGKRPNKVYIKLVLLFLIVTTFSALMGLLSQARPSLIFEDVKPLSFFLILPFFAVAITNLDIVSKIPKLIIYSALCLGTLYLIIICLINTGIIPFKDFYQLTNPTGELFYRGELAFFYKGFIYLCIGLIFILLLKPQHYKVTGGIILLAIILTFTRGFLFALLLTALVFQFFRNNTLLKKIFNITIICICLVVIVVKGGALYAALSETIYTSKLMPELTVEYKPKNLLGNRDFSNDERKRQARQVLERTTLTSLIVGHGLGVGVPVRPVHMEISYLEIFHKQGIIGLLFWGIIFIILTNNFLKARKKNLDLADAFYFGSLFVFFQSLTNQYFNNPIGMSFILISLVSLHVISKKI